MRRFTCCFRKSKEATEGGEEGDNAGGQTPDNRSAIPGSEVIGGNFTFEELSEATENFQENLLIGRGGFGKVYFGRIQRTKQNVAIKRLHRLGNQGNREFEAEISALSQADHPNLIKLLGHCIKGNERLLVYEFLHLGSLHEYLFDLGKEPLDWKTRMKIAFGAANGLEYLHKTMNPPFIHRDIKAQNILLDDGCFPKLSDFGVAREGPTGDKTYVSTRAIGTEGWYAPEYACTGHLTFKSDVYSFGVLLLAIVTGREAYDRNRPGERSLAAWARSMWRRNEDPLKMVDPRLKDQYPKENMQRFLKVALLCILENPDSRPDISDVCMWLDVIASQPYNPGTDDQDHAAESSRTAEERGPSS